MPLWLLPVSAGTATNRHKSIPEMKPQSTISDNRSKHENDCAYQPGTNQIKNRQSNRKAGYAKSDNRVIVTSHWSPLNYSDLLA